MDKIEFGKGNVLISATFNSIIIRILKENYQIGSSKDIKDVTPIKTRQINFYNKQQINEFKDYVKNSYLNPIFTFQDITFDFSIYNRDSVDVLLDQINWVNNFISGSKIS